MNKPVLGMVVGGVLGIFDGLSALLSAPEVRPDILGIVIGSTIKGVIAGLIIGWYARKKQSLSGGIIVGLIVGGLLAYAIVAMGGGMYFWEIVLPGAVLGIIVGYATQRYGTPAARVPAL